MIHRVQRSTFILKAYWCTEAQHCTCRSVMMSETSSLTSPPFFTWFCHSEAAWQDFACPATAKPLSCPALLMCMSAMEVKHVSVAWDVARRREMSQKNTCQVMSSPVSADGLPQLLKCTETHCAAPVWSHFCSHNSGTAQPRCLQGFHYSLVMKPNEVKRDTQCISDAAWCHIVSESEKVLEYQSLCPVCC